MGAGYHADLTLSKGSGYDAEVEGEPLMDDYGEIGRSTRKCACKKWSKGHKKCLKRAKRCGSHKAPKVCRMVLSQRMTGARSHEAKSNAMLAYHNCLDDVKRGTRSR